MGFIKMLFKWPWSGRPDGWTVIDAQDGLYGVSVKSPRKPGERPTVVSHGALPRGTLDETSMVQLGKLMHANGFPLIHVLSRKEYQMFLVDKAAVRAEELEGSLRWSLTPLLDYPASEANLSWMDIPQTHAVANRTPQLYVIAARRELINQRMDLLERAHMPLKVLDIRETGQRNISAAIQDQEAAVCLLYAEPNGVQLTVTYQGDLYLERYIREALFKTNDDGSPVSDEAKFDRVALEVQRSIDFVHRNASGMPFDGIFIAPTQSEIGLVEKLQSRILKEIRPLDLSSLFVWPDDSDLVKPEVQAKYFNALGAALRMKE